MTKSRKTSELDYDVLKDIYQDIKNRTYEERISELGLKPDRADVIEPAAEIFLNVMRWSGAEVVNVPKTGMGDGVIRKLYQEYKMK
jgi:exopolyphosphatase/guanosine-5'-triphosphate,3'-diphosphate pyrophosphatase